MPTHRFSVNVPNPDTRSTAIRLRLEPARAGDLSWLPREDRRGKLEVVDAGIALEPCARRGKQELEVEVGPNGSLDVHVVVNTAASGRPGIAAFHLIDQRNGTDVGGALLVCADPAFTEPPGQVVVSPNPCPAVLASNLYAVISDTDPADRSATRPMLAGRRMDLVAAITNPTALPLAGTRVYLEHLGGSNAAFAPATWNVGSLAPGAVFYATWSVRPSEWQIGTFAASVVAMSEGTDPVRLTGKFTVQKSD